MLEHIELKEEVKHTENFDRDDLISPLGELNANDVLLAIKQEDPYTKLTLKQVHDWLEECRKSPETAGVLVYTADVGIAGELITAYAEYNQKDKDISDDLK